MNELVQTEEFQDGRIEGGAPRKPEANLQAVVAVADCGMRSSGPCAGRAFDSED